MRKNLIIRYLSGVLVDKERPLRALLLLFLSMQNRGVLLGCQKAFNDANILIINVLNNIFVFGFAKESMYLCKAKVPYYGRSEDRHRAHDYASPIRDAAGSRGVGHRGWRNV